MAGSHNACSLLEACKQLPRLMAKPHMFSFTGARCCWLLAAADLAVWPQKQAVRPFRSSVGRVLASTELSGSSVLTWVCVLWSASTIHTSHKSSTWNTCRMSWYLGSTALWGHNLTGHEPRARLCSCRSTRARRCPSGRRTKLLAKSRLKYTCMITAECMHAHHQLSSATPVTTSKGVHGMRYCAWHTARNRFWLRQPVPAVHS